MSQLNKKLNDSRSDFIYYDLVVTNQASQLSPPTPFSYYESRSSPFVSGCPSDYKMSIVRFSVDSQAPVFIPLIAPNQSNSQLTIYQISVQETNTGLVGSAPVLWQPQDSSIPMPLPPSQQVNNQANYQSGYYNCYSYNLIMLLMTQAVRKAIVNLISEGSSALLKEAPIFFWDASRQCMDVYFQPNYIS